MPEDPGRAPLPPGSTIGILGSGQLGRMLAVAASRLGLKTHVFCADSGPACDVATRTTRAGFEDRAALATFARGVDAVTFESENVGVQAARYLSDYVPVRPSAKALEVAQDRLIEKEFIAKLGIPVAPFRRIDGPADVAAALVALGGPAILKSRRWGYDGKGQAGVTSPVDASLAWAAVGRVPAVLERRIAFAFEISALAVRGQDGAMDFYACPRNTHEGGILRRSVVPAGLPAVDLERASEIAGTLASALNYVGVLAVEMFYLGADTTPEQRLMVNEIAPRVHNSGHWTIEACAISQFENHMRAVAGWPLGSTRRHSDAEMVNLIGSEALDWSRLAAEPGVALHLYAKREARAGRKMGHVTRLRGSPLA
jgi:5-(carboxyamino)imidazole ribonucleotide synthase